MNIKYVSIEEAAKGAGEETFLRRVKGAILGRFVEQGKLQGKVEGGSQLVADDEALARIQRLGVETFVYNQQGYSIVAVRAPIDPLAEKIKKRPGVMEYEVDVQPQRMIEDLEIQPDEKTRATFLVQMRENPEWCVLIQTVHWFHTCDAIMGTALAIALSKEMQTTAASA